jgi:diguanylate cyclase (GGDEF)-like protein
MTLATAKPLILVVDDDLVIREYARSALVAAGMAVECAPDGVAGLQAFESLRPDLVLMDVSMPRMDGFEACAEIRRLPGGEEVPVIIATGMEDHESMERAFIVGATDFITKPLAAPVLQNRVRFTLRAMQAITQLRESQRQLGEAQELARLGSWQLELESRQLTISSGLRRVLELEPTAPFAAIADFLTRVHPADRELLEKSIRNVEARRSSWNADHRILTKRGAERVVHTTLEYREPLPGYAGVIVGTVQDVTLRKKTEEEIRQLAYFDILTGLPNRRLFVDRLARALESADRRRHKMALLFIDVDRFKRINDTLGHAAGDELLGQLTSRLIELVRIYDGVARPGESNPTDALSRLGGDEFTVFIGDLVDTADAARVARRILDSLREPIRLGEEDILVSASIGIAIYPDDADSAEALQKHADTAMYHAKRSGGGRYQFFSQEMSKAARRKLKLENWLRRDLEADRIEVQYQPMVDARSNAVVGVEALARWNPEGGGPVGPDEFIPIAEESGLIDRLGESVLRKACVQIGSLEGIDPDFRLSVNVSVAQLRRPGFVGEVRAILDETHFDVRNLDLEITESVLLEDGGTTRQTLERLRELGLRLSLDDFGTGYASMGYLHRVPIGALKIDRSFTAGVPDNRENAAIVSATIAMATRLDLSVTVEGVETTAEADFVRDEGGNTLQGYLISRPLELDALEQFLTSWKARL